MIKHTKIPKHILSLIPAAENYLVSVPAVIFAYLFGGLVKHGVQPLSDVDIAIHLEPKADLIETKLEVIDHLIDILQTDEIDLVVLNQASLSLKMRILENKEILVDKNPFVRHAFESLTMRKYFDFSYLEKGILKRRYLNG